MKVLGIITAPEKNKGITERLLHPIIIKEETNAERKYIAAELSISTDRLADIGRHRLKKMILKADRLLKNRGAAGVVLTNQCKSKLLDRIDELPIEFERSCVIPASKMEECLAFVLTKITKVTSFSSAVLFDRELCVVDKGLLEKVCQAVKQISLYTCCTAKAEKLAEFMYREYGVCMFVGEYNDLTARKKAHILIDIDNARVRAGDFVVDGAEFISDIGEYELDGAEAAAVLGEENNMRIKCWLSGGRKVG